MLPNRQAAIQIWRKTVFFFIFCLTIISAYSAVLKAPFILDDFDNIVNNDNIKIEKIGFSELVRAGFAGYCKNRPIPKITFALNYYFGGMSLPLFHIINILIHILNGVLVYLLIRKTLYLCEVEKYDPAINKEKTWNINTKNQGLIAFFAAFIWAVHPIQIQSVTYIVQRMNSMAAFFFIASLLTYIKGREFILESNKITGKSVFLFSMASVFFLLGVFSKENVIMLPFFIIIYEFLFFQKKNAITNTSVRLFLYCCILIILVISLLYLGLEPLKKIHDFYKFRNFTMYERIITEWRVIWFYIYIYFVPLPSSMNIDHDFIISKGLFQPITTITSFIGITGLIIFSIWKLKKKDYWVFIWISWFLGNLFLESSFIALEIIFEHRCYLPSIGLASVISLTIFRLFNDSRKTAYLNGLIIIMLFFLTYSRNLLWRDDVSLYNDAIKKSPAKLRPYIYLGNVYYKRQEFEKAEDAYSKALKIDPYSSELLNNIGVVFATKGDLGKAVQYFRNALEIDPQSESSKKNLRKALMPHE